MRCEFTLPELEAKLDELHNGGIFHIDRQDYERLFGMNDAALGRLRNFARSHRCVASFADATVLFRRQSPPVGDEV